MPISGPVTDECGTNGLPGEEVQGWKFNGGGQFPDNSVLISVVKGLIRSANVCKRWEMDEGAIFCSWGRKGG